MNTNTKSTRSANANENAIFSDIAKYRIIIEQAKSELEALENEIKNIMQLENIETITGLEHKATFKAVTSNRLDTKLLKVNDPATYEMYLKESTSNRFTFN